MADVKSNEKWDLTNKMLPFLDRHLIQPLLKFLEDENVYPESELKETKYKLLAPTNMIDSMIDLQKSIPSDPSLEEELKTRRTEVLQRFMDLKLKVKELTEYLDSPENSIKSTIENRFETSNASNVPKFNEQDFSNLYDLAKFSYECGMYPESLNRLTQFIALSNNQEAKNMAHWGKLACNILLESWDAANSDLIKLKELIEHNYSNSILNQHQNLTFLFHWALFVYARSATSRFQYLEWFLQDRYYSLIQITCPHIRRYLIASFINRKRCTSKDIQRLLESDHSGYSDPIIKYFEALYLHYDFELAEKALNDCYQVFQQDYFLNSFKDEFFENAKDLIFETFCSVHSKIDMQLLSERLGKSPEESEKWIVNMVHNSKLDCKIDCQMNQVIIGTQVPSIYQQLIDRSRSLNIKPTAVSIGDKDRGHSKKPLEHGAKEAIATE